MNKVLKSWAVALAAAFVAACGGDGSQSAPASVSRSPGTVAINPPFRIASLDAATLGAELGATSSGAQLLQITGAPSCGVDVYYLKFYTLGGAKETTESSGALMVPTGGSGCSGPRPIVLYAHGTNFNKALNIADITDQTNTEGVLIAAMFAAQGYIVVAPNYAGYDISNLGYHPFLDAAQQSGEMMDILTAARTALPATMSAATSDNGQLFVTGYSEGGHVAMATQRALQAAKGAVTAAAPMSGPYALEAFVDAIFFGSVDLGSTAFTPLLVTSYQKAYGNIFTASTDIYSSTYVNGIVTLLPSVTPLDTIFSTGLLPQTALFNSATPTVSVPEQPELSAVLTAALKVPSDPANPNTPLFQLGFGTSYLVLNDYRVSYALDAATNPDGAVPTAKAGVPLAAVAPTQALRKALYLNDMRNGNWAPTSPTLLCGGDQDPTVFYSVNTETMAAFWKAQVDAGLITVVDVNGAPAGPFAPIQTAFVESQDALLAFYQTPAGGGLSPQAAQQQLVIGYHTAVAPFCAAAARAFFSNFLGGQQ